MTLLLNCQHVEFRYPDADDPPLRGTSLSIHKGEWLSLISPNGCGKPTLLHCIAELNRYRDDIKITDVRPRNTPYHRLTRRAALMP